MYIKIWRKRVAKYIYLCNSALRRYFAHQLAVFKRPPPLLERRMAAASYIPAIYPAALRDIL